jgi:hypothetical protein
MAAFCHFWGISPSEYWALTIAEVSVMVQFANDYVEAQRQAQQ